MAINKRILESPQFRHGSFQNSSPTPMLGRDTGYLTVLNKNLHRPSTTRPSSPLISVRTDLRKPDFPEPAVIWFGHSSYLITADGKNILVDPVFSGHASPVSFLVRAFPGSDVYHSEDMPPIDLLVITHNHYDHLDTRTISHLAPGVKAVVTALGVGKILSECGIPQNLITELDWWESVLLDNLEVTATPARHFSGRGLKRGGTLWASFVLKCNNYSIFIGGDSGYDKHFQEIGEKFGPLDLAILECGQYSEYWPYIHMMPEETVQAAIDLKSKVLLPVHWGKFSLSIHPWTEPVERVVAEAMKKKLKITTPMIGEPVVLNNTYPLSAWWKS